MLYGEEKVRSMARSILPATNRRSARQTAERIKRRNRRNTRQTLHMWKRCVDPLEFEGHIVDYGEPDKHNGWSDEGTIKQAMWARRDADKLNSMIRWAKAYTAHLEDPEDRYRLMKKVLPDNLIGRHALSHLVVLDEFYIANEFAVYRQISSWHAVPRLNREVLEEMVKTDLKSINRQIRRHNDSLFERERERYSLELCKGVHDEEFFEKMDEIARSRRPRQTRWIYNTPVYWTIYNKLEFLERVVEYRFPDGSLHAIVHTDA
jgi:hypothetical protein